MEIAGPTTTSIPRATTPSFWENGSIRTQILDQVNTHDRSGANRAGNGCDYEDGAGDAHLVGTREEECGTGTSELGGSFMVQHNPWRLLPNADGTLSSGTCPVPDLQIPEKQGPVVVHFANNVRHLSDCHAANTRPRPESPKL